MIPARAGKPKDKAKVEFSVLLVTRWILAALRKRRFFSLEEVNEAISELLGRLNNKPFQKRPSSRQDLFKAIDRPAAHPLPNRRYEYAEITRAKVNIDYHVALDDHFYSVPFQLRSETITARLTITAVEIFFKHRRVATHRSSYKKWEYTTTSEHMPRAHRHQLEWTPSRIISWAQSIGPSTATLVEGILTNMPHPEQGYRGCLGIFRLARQYGSARVEAASERALSAQAFRYKHIKLILEKGLDRQPLNEALRPAIPIVHHDNIRGGNYYTQEYEEESRKCLMKRSINFEAWALREWPKPLTSSVLCPK